MRQFPRMTLNMINDIKPNSKTFFFYNLISWWYCWKPQISIQEGGLIRNNPWKILNENIFSNWMLDTSMKYTTCVRMCYIHREKLCFIKEDATSQSGNQFLEIFRISRPNSRLIQNSSTDLSSLTQRSLYLIMNHRRGNIFLPCVGRSPLRLDICLLHLDTHPDYSGLLWTVIQIATGEVTANF